MEIKYENIILRDMIESDIEDYDHLAVGEIYDWNEGSRRCFESVGFVACDKTKKGSSYRLTL